MSLSAIRHVLRSNERNVIIEAPAGCGKTYEAAKLAIDVGVQLKIGTEVLLLAHTNAAVQEFARRIDGTGARVHATTIDAFCLNLLSPYANRIGLPSPLRRFVGTGEGRIPFEELAPRIADLLHRCPSIASLVACRYPFIILDEHQDANLFQHSVVTSVRNFGDCRVRVFGDPMQAIYESDDRGRPSWDQLVAEANISKTLIIPQRWDEHPDLGAWICLARTELQAGRNLPLQAAPQSVNIQRVTGLRCAGFGYGNVGAIGPTVREFLRNSGGSAAILSRYNNHVWGLHVAAAGKVRVNEGAEFNAAYGLVENAIVNINNPQRMAACLLAHIETVSTGMDGEKKRSATLMLQADRIEYGRFRVMKDFVRKFEPLYRSPDFPTFCEVVRDVIFSPPAWLTIRMPMCMRLVAQIRQIQQENAIEYLDEIVARFKARPKRPARCASSIHKVKGLDFDHVLIGNFSSEHFPDDEISRRIAYVALSRARKSITLLVPELSPSPLLG
jgi:hypothetical protein